MSRGDSSKREQRRYWRCGFPIIKFRSKFVYFVQQIVEKELKVFSSFKADDIKTPWMARAMARRINMSLVDYLGALIEWVIEREKDHQKTRISSWTRCAQRGQRWRPEIRSWLEENRPLWAEATLESEVYCAQDAPVNTREQQEGQDGESVWGHELL